MTLRLSVCTWWWVVGGTTCSVPARAACKLQDGCVAGVAGTCHPDVPERMRCAEAADKDCDALERSITVDVIRSYLPPFDVEELLRVSVAERQCTEFRVRNVTLVETLEADGRAAGNNDIRIFFGQVPQSTPAGQGIFRVAQYNFRYLEPDFKEPDVADQPVDSFRFVLFGE